MRSQPAWIARKMELGQLPVLEFSLLFSKEDASNLSLGCYKGAFKNII